MPVLHCSLKFGSKTINYQLSFRQRKTLGIRIYPDCSVKVIAPIDTSRERIEEKLKSKAPWILRQQNDFLSFHPLTPPRRYINGETHLYMGRQYRLSIVNEKQTMSDGGNIKLERGRIYVYSPKNSKKHLAAALDKWYRKKAEEWFLKLIPACRERFPKKYRLSIADCELSIQKMSTRWGSCTSDGKIILNPELIKAPRGSIEYVIIHELCHLVYHNHTKAFYALQERIMPDWKQWKERLETLLV